MKLVFVTDNGFSEKNGVYYYSAPNYTHVRHLKPYFSDFVFVARKDKYDSSSFKIGSNRDSDVHLFNKRNVFEMIKLLKEQIRGADFVICYGITGYFACQIGKKYGVPTIAYNGGDVYEFLKSRGTLRGQILAPIMRHLEEKKFGIADYAHYCDGFLVDRYPTQGKVLVASGVSIDIEEINLEKRIKKIRSPNTGRPVIGLIGHTKNNLKGIGTAIRAVAKMGGDVELQIVGRGEHAQYDVLAESLKVKDSIKFLGTLKAGDEIFNWLDNIDVYIQPSLVEGLPRATIEAMSRGCPVVASNAGGLPRLIDSEFRIEFGDYVSLAEKLTGLLSDEYLMEEQAIENFEKAKEFSSDIRIKKYDEFYSDVIKSLERKNRNLLY
ncbi:MAG: glycosyltransferase family 4 protein [Clostridiaceae bacterium]|nr:glycosyltransferase family 4 protein [Clostridiaceae bacterium]